MAPSIDTLELKDLFAGPKEFNTLALTDYHFAVAKATVLPPVDKELTFSLPRSGPQGSIVPYTLIEDPAAWTVESLNARREEWIYHLTEQDIEELDEAIAAVEAAGMEIIDVKKEHFPLPSLGPKIAAFNLQVARGTGCQVVRGVPVQRYSRRQAVLAYWGFGLHLGGTPVPQNSGGHLLGHVRDIGNDPKNPNTRPYSTNIAQPWHNDGADMVGLLCLAKSKIGGLSNFASSFSVINEMLKRGRKDLVECLATADWWIPRGGFNKAVRFRNEDGSLSFFNLPPLNYHQGYLAVDFRGPHYFRVLNDPAGPGLSDLQLEALRTYTALLASPELCMDWVLEPGDIQLLNNLSMVHTRTAFTDTPGEPHRHLLRLWLAPKEAIPLPDSFLPYYGSTTPGARGGWQDCKGGLHIPLEPEFAE